MLFKTDDVVRGLLGNHTARQPHCLATTLLGNHTAWQPHRLATTTTLLAEGGAHGADGGLLGLLGNHTSNATSTATAQDINHLYYIETVASVGVRG